ncbi:hypothetical protein DIPPA_13702 [Diplonema papillatum]|nr:hypothetical protein DIPPA_13702 [Diplonema papillatum]
MPTPGGTRGVKRKQPSAPEKKSKQLKGVSSEEAARKGPVSTKLDDQRLANCCSAMLIGTATPDRALGELSELAEAVHDAKKAKKPSKQAAAVEAQPASVVRAIYLTWTCHERFSAEKFVRTRLIRLHHSPYKNAKSCLVSGGPVHRYEKKNKRRPAVDTVVSVKSLRHTDLDVQEQRLREFCAEYPFILCDNRCVNELPLTLRKRVAVKVDCSDMRTFRKKLEWAARSTAIKTGKGQLSVKVGTNLLASPELQENVRFFLRFVEDHMPEVWRNVKEVSIFTDGKKPLKLLARQRELRLDDDWVNDADGSPAVDEEDPTDDLPKESVADAAEGHEGPAVGIDIFALPRKKRRRLADDA